MDSMPKFMQKNHRRERHHAWGARVAGDLIKVQCALCNRLNEKCDGPSFSIVAAQSIENAFPYVSVDVVADLNIYFVEKSQAREPKLFHHCYGRFLKIPESRETMLPSENCGQVFVNTLVADLGKRGPRIESCAKLGDDFEIGEIFGHPESTHNFGFA